MDWKLAATTFGLVFVAEIGDKTQLAALALSGRSGKPFSVWVGAALALAAASVLGVVAGAVLHRVLPQKAVDIVAALLFIGAGIFLLVKALR